MKSRKWCNRCKRTLGIARFARAPKKYDGLNSYCKECHREMADDWRRRNPKKVKEANRQSNSRRTERYRTDSKFRKQMLAYKREWTRTSERRREAIRSRIAELLVKLADAEEVA